VTLTWILIPTTISYFILKKITLIPSIVIYRYIALAGVALPFLVMFLLGGANFVIDLVAYLYPAYASVRAIETDDTDDDTQWLTYWLVFSMFKMLEGVADSLLQYIPLYMVAKCSFLMWCFHPSFNGATVCYNSFIRPHVMPLLGHVDNDSKEESKKTK
jgi:receptor expression-enhancing protein 5/6